MFNKNFFLGILTTLVVVVILAVGGMVAFGAARPGAVGFAGSDRLEQQIGVDADQFGDGPDSGFRGERGEHGHGEFSPLRGLGGILGSLLIIGLVVGAVVGGQWAYRRLRGQPAPAVVAAPPETPAEAVDAAAGPDDADLAEIGTPAGPDDAELTKDSQAG